MLEFNSKILIIDDSVENLKLLGNALKQQSYNVLTALNGKQGLALVQNKHPDLILLDVMMPEMDGFEVCYKLKENPLTANIPTIFISALSQPEYIQKGYSVGGSDYLSKPVNMNDLGLRIKNFIRIKSKFDFNQKTYALLRDLVGLHSSQAYTNETGTNYQSIDHMHNVFMSSVIDVNWTFSNTFRLQELLELFSEKKSNEQCYHIAEWIQETHPFRGFPLFKLFKSFLNEILAREFKTEFLAEVSIRSSQNSGNYLSLEFSSGKNNIDHLYTILTKTGWENGSSFSSQQLSIFRKFLELLECRVHVIHRNNEHTLELLLPLYHGNYLRDTEIEERKAGSSRSLRVLCIEDDMINRDFLSSAFEELRIKATICSTATEGLARFSDEHFDIVLSDLTLPDMHGNQLVRNLRNELKFKGTAIAISGYAEQENISQSLCSGFNDYIVKPFTICDLQNTLLKHAHQGPGDTTRSTSDKKETQNVFDISKAMELADNDTFLVKSWLNNFCNILKNSKDSLKNIQAKGEYTERVKAFHDLRNYASYFGIGEIIDNMNKLQTTKTGQKDYALKFNETISYMEKLLGEALIHYTREAENLS